MDTKIFYSTSPNLLEGEAEHPKITWLIAWFRHQVHLIWSSGISLWALLKFLDEEEPGR